MARTRTIDVPPEAGADRAGRALAEANSRIVEYVQGIATARANQAGARQRGYRDAVASRSCATSPAPSRPGPPPRSSAPRAPASPPSSPAARFYDPDAGTVRLGGVPLPELTPAQLFDAVTVVFQDVYLSGGERQRISIARAILKDAPVILLDEAT